MKYTKHPIPEEITDKGGASVQLVDKQTVPLDGSIEAAIEAHYCVGQKTFIAAAFFGTMKSMAAGVRRDGRPRRIDGFLTVYPVFKGKVDLARGFDPKVNKVQIKARLLNEMELDITNWSFEDVTPGKKPFTLDSVKAGAALGVVEIGQVIELNGQDLPATESGEELRVHWEVEGADKSGDIPAAKLTSDVGRADIAADALDELKSAEYDGKTVVFTVRGNFSSAKIAAKLKYVAPPPTELDLAMYSLSGNSAIVTTDTPEGFEGTATATGGKLIGRITCGEDPEFLKENAEFVFDEDYVYDHPTFKYVAGAGTFSNEKTYHLTVNRRAGKEAEYTPAFKTIDLVIV